MDTVGAWPTFECEVTGQSEAIATNLTVMAGLKVPIITVLVGEGGSGGALGICMGNSIGVRLALYLFDLFISSSNLIFFFTDAFGRLLRCDFP